MNQKKELNEYVIERGNQFNQYRPYDLTLSEIRFFILYQAKINARKNKTDVTLSLNEFVNAVGLSKVNVTNIKKIGTQLIHKTVTLPVNIDGAEEGFTLIPLFSEFTLYKKDGSWFVNIKCNDKLIPYIFDMRGKYFKYQLWNALSLSSINQIRLYEILKQYEKIGRRTLKLKELKNQLGVKPDQYQVYSNFRRRVLDPCQQSINENTDIKFEYEGICQGIGREITSVTFIIEKNENYVDKINANQIIENLYIEDNEDNIDILQKEITIENSAEEKLFIEQLKKIQYIQTVSGNIYSEDELLSFWTVIESTQVNGKYSIDSYLLTKCTYISSRLKKGEIIYDAVAYMLKLIDIDVENISD